MKKKIYAIVLALMLACALIACGDKDEIATTNKLKLDNYAVFVDDAQWGETVTDDVAPFTGATALDGTFARKINEYVGAIATSEETFKLYDLSKKSYLLNGEAFPTVATENGSRANFLIVSKKVNDGYQQALYDPTGTLQVLPYALYEDVTVEQAQNRFVANSSEFSRLYIVTYRKSGENEKTQTAFVQGAVDFVAGEMVYALVAESDVRTSPIDTTVGNILNGTVATRIVFDPLSDKYAEYTMSSLQGNGIITYTVYKSGVKTGEFSVSNGDIFRDEDRLPITMDRYLYYYESVDVPSDAKNGYNVYEGTSAANARKRKVTYYKYDFVKNKKSTFNPGYYIDSVVSSVYNYKNKTFDAATVYAVPFVNGVAVLGDAADTKTFTVDKNFKVGFDLTEKPFMIDDGICLRSGKKARYLFGAYITDAKLQILATLPIDPVDGEVHVYKQNGVIVFTYNEAYAAVDFDGKVVLDAKYENLSFVGDTALTAILGKDDEEELYVVTTSTPDGTKLPQGRTPISNGVLASDDGKTLYNYKGDTIVTQSDAASVTTFKYGKTTFAEFRNAAAEIVKTYVLN